MQALAQAGELSLKLPRDFKIDKLGRSVRSLLPSGAEIERVPSRALAVVARNDANAAAFIEKFKHQHCRSDVSEEWRPVDDSNLDKLRGILAALKEENQATQLLKKESEDRQASQELEATRQSVRARLEACRGQVALFEEKQAELKRHVLENEKALRLMETNIEKGERKSREEQAECRRLDGEVRAVERDIEEHEEGKSLEERLISRAAQHKAFLESVVQECEEDFEGDIKVLMNRYNTLEVERQSLHTRNTALASQLNRVQKDWLKVQADLQTEQMMSSSRLHECQVAFERHRAESNSLEQDLNRMLEEKELNKSKVGVILMAIEQIFTRTVQSCRLKQRREAMLAEVDTKYAPVRADRADARLEAMLNQIIARVTDLRDMSDKVRKHLDKEKKPEVVVLDEVDILDKVQFVHQSDGHARPAVEASSSRQSSDLALGANNGSMRASQATSIASAGSGEPANGAPPGGEGPASPAGGPPGVGRAAAARGQRTSPRRRPSHRGSMGIGHKAGGSHADVMPEVTPQEVTSAFRAPA